MRSGLPRSTTRTASPPNNRQIARPADTRAIGLYASIRNTEANAATFNTPDASSIRKIANTCGRPQTTWLFMPVTQWPFTSMKCAAPRPATTNANNKPSIR